jgi:hypothetical protein
VRPRSDFTIASREVLRHVLKDSLIAALPSWEVFSVIVRE